MNWVRSTFCDGGSCVEAAHTDTEERCFGGECVEVAFDADGNTAVRASHSPADVIWFTREEWTAFLAGVVEGQFNFGMNIT